MKSNRIITGRENAATIHSTELFTTNLRVNHFLNALSYSVCGILGNYSIPASASRPHPVPHAIQGLCR